MGMGYQGYARFYKKMNKDSSSGVVTPEGSITVLATSASVNLVLEPIYSSAVWGAGWYNAAESAHYADNAIRYEGNIETELQVGENGDYWNLLQDFAISHRAFPKGLEISPDGAHVYRYYTADAYNTEESYNDPTKGAYCTSLNFQTSAGSFITSSIGILAISRTDVDPAGGLNFPNYAYIKQARGVIGGDIDAVKTLAPLNPDATNVNPIPYWKSNARLFTTRRASQLWTGGQVGPASMADLFGLTAECKRVDTSTAQGFLPQDNLETVEWSVDLSNNQQIVYTCCGDRMPRAVLMGPMGVTGAITQYCPIGVYDPVVGPKNDYDSLHQYMTAQHTWFNVAIECGDNRQVFITVPAAVVESDEYSIQSADSVTNRAFNIKGLGGRCMTARDINFVLPPLVMSRYRNEEATSSTADDLLHLPFGSDGSPVADVGFVSSSSQTI